MIKAIIIDEEFEAINISRQLLEMHCGDEVQIVGTSNTPQEAKSLILANRPDLVFVEANMPGMTGIEFIRSFDDRHFKVVFVNVDDSYALDAFELNAIDYLLKPVQANKLIRVIQKMKDEINKQQALATLQLQKLERQLQKHLSIDMKIGISSTDKIVYLNIYEIMYCQAHGAYTNIYLRTGKRILASKTLGDFESQLSSQYFFRIHHSILINLNHVREFQRSEGYVVVDNNEKLEVSQRKRKDFLDAIDNFIL
ncbi:MAG TPA: LytTR family DNA-binding domain-containing protein [Flavitalea sp.]|nr:LytTR family DNA-binding domain-containing protein [Flavitalea sp.]